MSDFFLLQRVVSITFQAGWAFWRGSYKTPASSLDTPIKGRFPKEMPDPQDPGVKAKGLLNPASSVAHRGAD